jgi:hypothetical protein
MELSKKQKEHLLELISAGTKTREINKRAALFKPPYKVSRQQVDYYRDSREVKLKEIEESSESDALRTGLALREKRVEALEEVAQMLLSDLRAGRLWLDSVKAVGSGKFTTIVDYKEFNRFGLESFFKVLDEIAKETGERTYGIGIDEADEDEADEDGAEGLPAPGAQGGPELRIKVEYVGNPAAIADTASGPTEDQP